MHEMSYVIRLVNLAAKTAEEQNAKKVLKIVVEAGKMTGVEPYYMDKYYKTAIRGTILDGSEIEVIPVDVTAECACGCKYTPDAAHDYLCPDCGGGNCKITGGRSVVLERVVIEN